MTNPTAAVVDLKYASYLGALDIPYTRNSGSVVLAVEHQWAVAMIDDVMTYWYSPNRTVGELHGRGMLYGFMATTGKTPAFQDAWKALLRLNARKIDCQSRMRAATADMLTQLFKEHP